MALLILVYCILVLLLNLNIKKDFFKKVRRNSVYSKGGTLGTLIVPLMATGIKSAEGWRSASKSPPMIFWLISSYYSQLPLSFWYQ